MPSKVHRIALFHGAWKFVLERDLKGVLVIHVRGFDVNISLYFHRYRKQANIKLMLG